MKLARLADGYGGIGLAMKRPDGNVRDLTGGLAVRIVRNSECRMPLRHWKGASRRDTTADRHQSRELLGVLVSEGQDL